MGPASKPEQCRHQEISQQGHADVEGEAFGVRLLSPCQQPSLRSANLQLLCWIGLFWERVWNREEQAYVASLTITLLALWPSTHQPVPASTLFGPGTAPHLQSVALRGRLQSHSTPQPRSASIPQNIRQAHCTAIQSQSQTCPKPQLCHNTCESRHACLTHRHDKRTRRIIQIFSFTGRIFGKLAATCALNARPFQPQLSASCQMLAFGELPDRLLTKCLVPLCRKMS